MGTSLAIMGAYLLAGELSKLKDGEHPSKALEVYESTFHLFVEKMQEIPPFVPAIAHPETAWKRWLFQTFVTVISKAVVLPWFVNRLRGPSDEEYFPLPQYPNLDDESSK
jgi:hypothetical protein